MMSTSDNEVTDVLAQVVNVGPTESQVQLGAAVSRQVVHRAAPAPAPDPSAVAALRMLGENAAQLAGTEIPEPPAFSPLTVHVEFNDLLERLGEPDVWTVIGKLKDLLG